jgi:hypothetical protein
MSARCRNCGRSNRSRGRRPAYGSHHYRRRHRTVFSQLGFWGWVCLVLAAVWVLSDLGVIGS